MSNSLIQTPKAWNSTSTSSDGATLTKQSAYNLTITRTGAGTYTGTFDVPMNDTNYCVITNAGQSGLSLRYLTIQSKSTTAFTLNSLASDGTIANINNGLIHIVVFGA